MSFKKHEAKPDRINKREMQRFLEMKMNRDRIMDIESVLMVARWEEGGGVC